MGRDSGAADNTPESPVESWDWVTVFLEFLCMFSACMCGFAPGFPKYHHSVEPNV